jgi:uncharacterized repeat protein (TIGR01451 family)
MENHLRTTMRMYYQSIQAYSGMMIIFILLLLKNSTVHAQSPVPCTAGNIIPFTVTSEDATAKNANNAKIRITGGLNGDYRIGYSVGSTYTGPDFNSSPKYSTLAGQYMSQTLPTPTNLAGTVYTIRVYNTTGTCYTEQQFTLPYVHFNEKPKYPDIEVTAAASGGTGGFYSLGDLVTVTMTVRNLGDTLATNLTEKVTIPTGLNYVSHTAAAGTNYTTGTGVWDIGTMNKGDVKTLTFTLTVAARGIRSVTMNTETQLNGMVQTPALAPDKDSQPGNNALGEDDYGAVCISTPYDYCFGDEYTITVSSYTGIQWYKDGALITGATVGVTINNGSIAGRPAGSLTVMSTGVYTYSYPSGTCPGGGCCPIKVEAGMAPDVLPISNQIICVNDTFAAINSSLSPTGYTGPTTQLPNGPVVYKWYNDNGTANPNTTLAQDGGTGFTTLPTAVGVYKYKLKVYAQDHANCSDSTTFTLTINPRPLAPIAQNRTYCADESATALTATADAGNTLLWYSSATGGTASTTAPVPSTINASNTTAVTLNFWVSQKVDNTSCEGPRTMITVIINPRPAPPVAQNVTYCQEDIASALSATAGSGQTLYWYGTNSTGGVGSTTAPTPLTTSAGSVTYYVSQKIDATGCESNRAALVVTVNPKPVAPIAQNRTYCQDDIATPLTATSVAGQTLLWYSTATGGASSTQAPTPSTLSATTLTYYVSHKVDATNCESNRTPVTVLINPKPVAPIAQNRTYCADEVATALTATPALNNTLQWYTSATGGTASTTAPVPSTVNASNTTAVTLNWWVSQKVDGTGCESPRTMVTVTINPRPAPPAVTNVTYCQAEPASPLIATAGSNQTLFWYGTNSTGGVGSTSAPTPSTATAGSVTYYVTQKIDATGCESNRAALVVTVNPKPTAPIAQNATYCEGATASPLTATAVAGQTLYWYGQNSTGGTASTTAPIPSTTTAGTYTFYVSFKVDATGCESLRTPVTVLINPTPVPPTVSNVTYCQGATPSALTATAAGGNILQWYTSGVPSTTAPIPSTATAGVELFLVSQKVPGTSCESAQAVITVTVNPTPVAEVIAVNSLCIGTTTQNNGKLILTRYRNSDVVAFVAAPATLGTSPSWIDPIPAGGVFASGLANPSSATQDYFVRIKNAFNCTVDRVATLTKVDCGCPGGYCEPATVSKTK